MGAPRVFFLIARAGAPPEKYLARAGLIRFPDRRSGAMWRSIFRGVWEMRIRRERSTVNRKSRRGFVPPTTKSRCISDPRPARLLLRRGASLRCAAHSSRSSRNRTIAHSFFDSALQRRSRALIRPPARPFTPSHILLLRLGN